ncbi:MAG: YccF domain-containing protein [Hyphomicrobiaceae bacterium]
MSALSLLLNVLWIMTGGLWMAAGWLLAALVTAITIIGLPWARAALTIALYTFLPFGHTVVDRPSGALGETFELVGNLVWLLLAGWWLALGHIFTAIGLAITIIGIPFAWAHLKLAMISLWPVGKEVVTLSPPHPAMVRGGMVARR